MILVDSSVWINNLRDRTTASVRRLRGLDPEFDEIIVGDLILMEVLMGAPNDMQAARIQREMKAFPVVRLSDPELATEAARNYRRLRNLGVTVRGGVDMLIGAYCIAHGHSLLHDDREFEPMSKHLGLAVL